MTFYFEYFQQIRSGQRIQGFKRGNRSIASNKPFCSVSVLSLFILIFWAHSYKGYRDVFQELMIFISPCQDNILVFCHLPFSFLFFRTRFHFNPRPDDGGLFICCGQLVGKRGGPRHINCPGSNSGYRVGGLFLEMEYCPFDRCARVFTDPESNILHQEEVHRSIKTWLCSICECNFVSEVCATRHMLTFHRGPRGYAEDLEKVHEGNRPYSFSI